jgi:hypothetical protein
MREFYGRSQEFERFAAKENGIKSANLNLDPQIKELNYAKGL